MRDAARGTNAANRNSQAGNATAMMNDELFNSSLVARLFFRRGIKDQSTGIT